MLCFAKQHALLLLRKLALLSMTAASTNFFLNINLGKCYKNICYNFIKMWFTIHWVWWNNCIGWVSSYHTEGMKYTSCLSVTANWAPEIRSPTFSLSSLSNFVIAPTRLKQVSAVDLPVNGTDYKIQSKYKAPRIDAASSAINKSVYIMSSSEKKHLL